MKLFKIWQDVNDSYDTYDSAVVAADNENEAKHIYPAGNYYEWDGEKFFYAAPNGVNYIQKLYDWTHPDNVKVQYIGEAREGTEKGIIVASFNAG